MLRHSCQLIPVAMWTNKRLTIWTNRHIIYAYVPLLMHKEKGMRTTLDLPGPLIAEAMKLSNQKTKTAVIISALEDFVRKTRISDLKKYKGKVDLDIDLNSLRKRK